MVGCWWYPQSRLVDIESSRRNTGIRAVLVFRPQSRNRIGNGKRLLEDVSGEISTKESSEERSKEPDESLSAKSEYLDRETEADAKPKKLSAMWISEWNCKTINFNFTGNLPRAHRGVYRELACQFYAEEDGRTPAIMRKKGNVDSERKKNWNMAGAPPAGTGRSSPKFFGTGAQKNREAEIARLILLPRVSCEVNDALMVKDVHSEFSSNLSTRNMIHLLTLAQDCIPKKFYGLGVKTLGPAQSRRGRVQHVRGQRSRAQFIARAWRPPEMPTPRVRAALATITRAHRTTRPALSQLPTCAGFLQSCRTETMRSVRGFDTKPLGGAKCRKTGRHGGREEREDGEKFSKLVQTRSRTAARLAYGTSEALPAWNSCAGRLLDAVHVEASARAHRVLARLQLRVPYWDSGARARRVCEPQCSCRAPQSSVGCRFGGIGVRGVLKA
ncbi:hypothetical protein B0H13DRAFT_2513183 [Mycena leptocephala]|nr:hypothetical protein B0H13DRAFT_2513183 [Mycena leptocephala]